VPTVHARTLRRAAELVGGQEKLARQLQVLPNHLDLWIRGLLSPPGDVFLKAADIVSEHDLQEMAKPPVPDADKT
jgi:DNA-binding transcriptional regulator YdaS (Cro superfamily)